MKREQVNALRGIDTGRIIKRPGAGAAPFDVWKVGDYVKIHRGAVHVSNGWADAAPNGSHWFEAGKDWLDLASNFSAGGTVYLKHTHSTLAVRTGSYSLHYEEGASIPEEGTPDDAYDILHIATISAAGLVTQLRSSDIYMRDARRGHLEWYDGALEDIPDHFELATEWTGLFPVINDTHQNLVNGYGMVGMKGTGGRSIHGTADPYDDEATYSVDDYVSGGGKVYRAKVNNPRVIGEAGWQDDWQDLGFENNHEDFALTIDYSDTAGANAAESGSSFYAEVPGHTHKLLSGQDKDGAEDSGVLLTHSITDNRPPFVVLGLIRRK